MNAQIRTLIAALFFTLASNAVGMTYPAPKPLPNLPPTLPPAPAPPPVSICTTESNTIAIGIEYYPNGARIVCADAGQIGFWTTPVLGAGTIGAAASTGVVRFLCPSGSALSGVLPATGFPLPIPACNLLVPNLQDGSVTRGGTEQVSRCEGSKFVQSLKGFFNSQGVVNDLVPICNPILTTPAPTSGFDVDLAIRTLNQLPTLLRNDTDGFAVQVFNTGIGSQPMGDIRIELRFNANGWDVIPTSNISCQPLFALALGRPAVVGKRCTMPGTALGPRGGNVSTPFMLQPVGPESGRPATGVPTPIVSVKVVLTEGTAPNDANDRAAFPVRVF